MHRILFLCMGNICRSPAAHCYFQHLVDQAGLSEQFDIESAGTTGFHQGATPDARMQEVLRARGVPVIGRSKHFDSFDLGHYDLILAMDRENLADARRLDVQGRHAEKLKLFSEYCRTQKVTDVPDPYYGGERGFEKVMDLIEDGCQGLLEALSQGDTD